MAKDLPYFKFDVSEWINGLITLEEDSAQGLFINICAHYWFKSGKLKLSEIKRRLSKSKPGDFEALISCGVLKVKDDDIIITFMDDQLRERETQSTVNSANGRLGGRPKSEKKPTALIPLNEKKAKQSNIEEKRREENREEEKRKEKEVVHKNFSIDNYKTGSEAFEEIKNDDLMVNKLLRVVRLEGFQTCDEVTIMKATRHFFVIEEAKPDFINKPRDEHKKYLVNWLRSHALTLTKYG